MYDICILSRIVTLTMCFECIVELKSHLKRPLVELCIYIVNKYLKCFTIWKTGGWGLPICMRNGKWTFC